jgi:hypothetical protein
MKWPWSKKTVTPTLEQAVLSPTEQAALNLLVNRDYCPIHLTKKHQPEIHWPRLPSRCLQCDKAFKEKWAAIDAKLKADNAAEEAAALDVLKKARNVPSPGFLISPGLKQAIDLTLEGKPVEAQQAILDHDARVEATHFPSFEDGEVVEIQIDIASTEQLIHLNNILDQPGRSNLQVGMIDGKVVEVSIVQ